MTATSCIRGHEVFYDGTSWRYADNTSPAGSDRTCSRCGQAATAMGYDACLGHLPGFASACCGHGRENPYFVTHEAHQAIGFT